MTPSKLDPRIHARLYLHAVLPALEQLIVVSHEAAEEVADMDLAVEFRVPGCGVASVLIAEGKVEVGSDEMEEPDIRLQFLSADQCNRLFGGEKGVMPLPLRGLLSLGKIKGFERLTDRMKEFLEPPGERLRDLDFAKKHVRLALGVAVYGTGVLAGEDPAALESLHMVPPGLAVFSVPDAEASFWIDWRDGHAVTGKGQPPRSPDARITFQDSLVAVAALRAESDTLADVGAGRIRVEGRVPLADSLNLVMERMADYFPVKP